MKKRKVARATKQRKQEVFVKYREIIKFIYLMTNKVIYITQLKEVCFRFNLVRSRTHFYQVIDEIIGAGLASKEEFTQGQALILSKGAIQLLTEEEDSQRVKGVVSRTVAQRLKLNTLKLRYALCMEEHKGKNLKQFITYFKPRFMFAKGDYRMMGKHLEKVLYRNMTLKGTIYNDELRRYCSNRETIKNIKKGQKLNLEKPEYGGMEYLAANNCFFESSERSFGDKNEETLKFKFVLFCVNDYARVEKIAEIIIHAYAYYNHLLYVETGPMPNLRGMSAEGRTRRERLYDISSMNINAIFQFQIVALSKNISNLFEPAFDKSGRTILDAAIITKNKKLFRTDIDSAIKQEHLNINWIKY